MRRRFWTRACAVATAGGFAVLLDDRPLRLPGGAELRCASLPLAEAVAAEWNRAGASASGVFDASDVVLTGLAGTLQAHVATQPRHAVMALLRFVDGELLCYRASRPDALVALQRSLWQPWLDWLGQEQGAELRVTQGVMPIDQPAAALAALRRRLEAVSPGVLTGLGLAVPALGSLVLGLAMAVRRLDAAEAFRLSRLDEAFQAGKWGSDAAATASAERVQREVATAQRFMELADG